jgi:hypothetical protein
MSENVQTTTPDTWRAWKKHCAAERCGEAEAAMLRRFGSARFSYYVQRYADRVGHRGGALRVAEAADGWNLLESHVQISKTRPGKRYKDWLFARAKRGGPDHFLALMESGATLLMRTVVRIYLRKEHHARFMASLQAPRGGTDGEGTYTLEDLIPDASAHPADEVSEREWRELAIRHATDFFETMEFREVVTLWARGRGINLCDRRLLNWAGYSESALYKEYRKFLEKMGSVIKKFYPEESPEALVRMGVMIHEELGAMCEKKISVQKGVPRCFRKA